jgi:glycosyltransferase involved in cell wall biosynthesis
MVYQGEVEVKWVENTGPYRKLIPVFRAASDEDWLVTCDDDVIYGPGWLSALVQAAELYPFAVICGRARRPVKNPFGRNQSYLHWPLVPLGSSGKDLLPIGISGVLYRKHLLDKATMLSDEFKKIAPKQDDLWFHVARRIVGTEVVVSPEAGKQVYPIEAPGALSVMNATTKLSGWDKLFTALFERLALKLKAYSGMSVCDNDVTIAKLERLKKTTGSLF